MSETSYLLNRKVNEIEGSEVHSHQHNRNHDVMSKARLEAFSDGVFGVAATLMVIDIKADGSEWQDLRDVIPKIGLYFLSFTYIGIYWTNHHTLLHASVGVTGLALWANLLLLFCLTMLPFTTAWMGESFDHVPVAVYGMSLLLSAIAWTLLNQVLIAVNKAETGHVPPEMNAVVKGGISAVLYSLGIGLSFWKTWAGIAIYMAVAVIWVVPVLFNLHHKF